MYIYIHIYTDIYIHIHIYIYIYIFYSLSLEKKAVIDVCPDDTLEESSVSLKAVRAHSIVESHVRFELISASNRLALSYLRMR